MQQPTPAHYPDSEDIVIGLCWCSSLNKPLRHGVEYTGGHRHSNEIRKPMWYNGSTLIRNARDVGSDPALGTIFPIVITTMTLVAVIMILYKLGAVWLVNLPCIYIYIYIYIYM